MVLVKTSLVWLKSKRYTDHILFKEKGRAKARSFFVSQNKMVCYTMTKDKLIFCVVGTEVRIVQKGVKLDDKKI